MSIEAKPSPDGELDALLEAYCERARRGEQPAIEEYIALRPDLAEDIRLLFPTSLAMEDLASAAAAEPETPKRVGDYRLVREAGRGGMGIVYEAVQESLERRVALKVLPRSLVADANGLERFRREARAAARLHHTNIVPIFGVGEEGGINYYAMQFIDGRSLDTIIETARRRRGTGSPFVPDLLGPEREFRADARERGGSSGANSPERRHQRAVAAVGLQVAEALAYAHAQGIFHRDIKPSNLILDAHGTVWVTDFGLAKTADDGALWTTPALTQAGDIIGTIAYLAPERLEGKADGRSDVYALGLTLYELLTLEPAFKDENRRRLLKRVADETPPPPRAVDPTIPRDLETIILTASAKDPDCRYAGAAQLADDLRSFLAGRPIAARRPTAVERLSSWCRREPALAGLGALVLMLLAVIAAVSSYGYVRVSELLGIANENLGRAQLAEDQAHTELRRSYRAQANASRLRAQPGRRFDSLEAVRRAAALGPSQEELRALRAEAIAALGTIDLRIIQRLRFEPGLAATLSPDFASYAVSDPGDTRVSVHRTADQGEIASFPVPGATHGSLQFSGDGRFLAARLERGPDRLVVFEIASRRRVYVSPEPTPGGGVQFDPSSRTLVWVAEGSGEVHRVDLEEGREIASYPGEKGFGILAFHPSGESLTLAAANEKQIRLVEAATGRHLSSLDDQQGHTTMAWSGDGKLLAAGCMDGSVNIWEAYEDALHLRHALEKAKTYVVRIVFNHRGTLLSTYSWDPALRFWDPHGGDLLLSCDLAGYAFSPDDRRLAYSLSTGEEGVAEVVESEVCRLIVPPPMVRGSVARLEVSRDGRLLACGRWSEGTVLFDLEENRYLPGPPAFRGVQPLFAGDGEWLVTRSQRRLQRWRLERRPGDGSSGTPGGPGGGRDRVEVLPPETIGEVPTASSLWLTQSADSSTLAVLGRRAQGEIVVFTRDGDGWRSRTMGPHMSVDRIALQPDGRRLASSTWLGRDVKVWNTETAALEHTIPLWRNAFVEYSPDGRWLAVMAPEACTLHDAATLDPAHRIEKPPQGGYPGRVSFSADSRLMALSYDRASVLLVHPATGVELAKLEARSLLNRTLAFRPDGRHLYCGALNGGIYDWDLTLLRSRLRELGLDWTDPAD